MEEMWQLAILVKGDKKVAEALASFVASQAVAGMLAAIGGEVIGVLVVEEKEEENGEDKAA